VIRYAPEVLEMRIYIRRITTVRDSVKGKDMMIANLACCTPEQTVRQAAEMMLRHDCGEIAIVETVENLKPIGVITDRDIAWRVVATGKIPAQTSVRDAMSSDL
jgi:CBS domain-containing protein